MLLKLFLKMKKFRRERKKLSMRNQPFKDQRNSKWRKKKQKRTISIWLLNFTRLM